MHFELLQRRLVEHIRSRVRTGELTERSLARLAGVSQPHLHNVLKGSRFLSREMADQILRELRICLFDLLEPEDWPVRRPVPGAWDGRAVAILAGRLGPGEPLPREALWERIPFLEPELVNTRDPALARLAEDPAMKPLFHEGDLALLDRAESLRREPEARSYYVVAVPDGGLLRHVRRAGDRLHLVSLFGAPDSIPVTDRNMLEVVKAKVVWIGRSLEPPRIAEGPFEPAG
jgi:hypothetical protein